MKRLFIFLFAVTLLSGNVSYAQENGVFNHLALGVTAGDDGFGFEIAAPLGSFLQVRGGYSIMPFTVTRPFTFGNVTVNGSTREMNNIPFVAKMLDGGQGRVMLDFNPSSDASFHFTIGAMFSSGNLLNTSGDIRNVLHSDEYGTRGIGLQSDCIISSDKEGYLPIDLKTNKIWPYVGVGFGQAVNPDRRVSAVFELGFAYSGNWQMSAYDMVDYYAGFSDSPEIVPLTSAAVRNHDRGAFDKLAKLPVFPVARLNVYFRLF
ncbi:MAG: hypothetical protein IKX60_01205 [Bacteroidales bacterium]|nr:hypothetical protein [Bacteroidales bacterium]